MVERSLEFHPRTVDTQVVGGGTVGSALVNSLYFSASDRGASLVVSNPEPRQGWLDARPLSGVYCL